MRKDLFFSFVILKNGAYRESTSVSYLCRNSNRLVCKLKKIEAKKSPNSVVPESMAEPIDDMTTEEIETPLEAPNGSDATVDPNANQAGEMPMESSMSGMIPPKKEDVNELTSTPIQNGDNQSFLLIGDAGTGEEGQFLVANAISEYCSLQQCDLALSLGDNIYETGAISVDDPQFIEKFEKPYENLDFTFYSTLGNHDVVQGNKGEKAQIDYTTKSEKWYLPKKYYRKVIGEMEIFSIDSNTIRKDDSQLAWLTRSLKESTAKWKFVFGHHPYLASANTQI